MYKYIIRRLIQAIPTFFGITVLAYMLMSLTPGGPLAALMFQENAGRPMEPEALAALEQRLGIRDSLPKQYLRWLIGDNWMVVENLNWYEVRLPNGDVVWFSEREVDYDEVTGYVVLESKNEYYRLEPREDARAVEDVFERVEIPKEIVATEQDGDVTWYQVRLDAERLVWIEGRNVDVDEAGEFLTLKKDREEFKLEPSVEAEIAGQASRVFVPLELVSRTVESIKGDRKGVLRGDFGHSFFNQRPVLDVIKERAIPTLELSVASLALSLILGVTVGVIAAVTRGGLFDNITRIAAVLLNSIPGFWFGLVLLYLLAFEWGLFPLGNRCATTLADSCPPIYERWQYMVLPVIVLSAGGVANFSRYMRASMLDIIGQDYIRTARAKGLSSSRIWYRHGMKNALIPIATFIGPAIVGLLGGAVITEQVFNYPGIGFAVFSAFIQRDYPIVMAVTIYASIVTILGYLISDVLYGLIDPRIRF